MLAFEANPHEIFGKRDASAAEAAIASILKDREIRAVLKEKYDAFIDGQTLNNNTKYSLEINQQ